mmetsp:Transcript_56571/g.165425  ORF Transcript_56571/g.165425 Transcript_56571/m.165425 type:complete len:178 (+) Transcript_56571:42-575(+)
MEQAQATAWSSSPILQGFRWHSDAGAPHESPAGIPAQQPMQRAARPRPREPAAEGLAPIPEGAQLGSRATPVTESKTGTDSRDVTPLYIPGVRDHSLVDDGAIARLLLRSRRHDAGLSLRREDSKDPACLDQERTDHGAARSLTEPRDQWRAVPKHRCASVPLPGLERLSRSANPSV